jgi:hypothetical protein
MTDNLTIKLVNLFDETKKAHGVAFAAANGEDAEWPLWYADYLMDKLLPLLSKPLTKSELVYVLVKLSKEHALESPDSKWTEYYAKFLVEQYG